MATKPELDPQDLFRHVYNEPTTQLRERSICWPTNCRRRRDERQKVSFAKALNTAHPDALETDRACWSSVRTWGFPRRRFPYHKRPDRQVRPRCFDTPWRSPGSSAPPWALAANGMRPVVEMQFDAFAYPRSSRSPRTWPRCTTAPAARAGHADGHPHSLRRRRGRCGAPIPRVYYAHTPGLKVFTWPPVTDAYLMLREAIDSRIRGVLRAQAVVLVHRPDRPGRIARAVREQDRTETRRARRRRS